ncbi:uncharacterized protein At4g00950-like [Salvia miltiorrhiza]|uniref:uncharacterized protein At4g00950-like n=1 Tax=Salvia miltiorrhiza TaxID=226208 RepID=UPI0025AD761F|nr:uncharacterized protein At4g00950-like [Salvia miltiorrhiza]
MGEEGENEASFPTLKLAFAEMPESPEHPSTPPFQASATIPFKWEEQPGKPRHCIAIARPEPAKSLELPPCMNPADKFTKTPSPTTVLDGPYNVARPKFSSFRFTRDGADSFGSPEGTAFEALLGAKKGKGRGFFGKFKGGKREVGGGGSCRFSPSAVSSCDSEDMFAAVKNNCGVQIKRNGSFSNISHAKPTQLWTSFCHGIKQVIHWKGSKKSNKEGRNSRSDM